jgi:hypothetical protein
MAWKVDVDGAVRDQLCTARSWEGSADGAAVPCRAASAARRARDSTRRAPGTDERILDICDAHLGSLSPRMMPLAQQFEQLSRHRAVGVHPLCLQFITDGGRFSSRGTTGRLPVVPLPSTRVALYKATNACRCLSTLAQPGQIKIVRPSVSRASAAAGRESPHAKHAESVRGMAVVPPCHHDSTAACGSRYNPDAVRCCARWQLPTPDWGHRRLTLPSGRFAATLNPGSVHQHARKEVHLDPRRARPLAASPRDQSATRRPPGR